MLAALHERLIFIDRWLPIDTGTGLWQAIPSHEQYNLASKSSHQLVMTSKLLSA